MEFHTFARGRVLRNEMAVKKRIVILIAAYLIRLMERERVCEVAAAAENRLATAVAPSKILGGAGSRHDRLHHRTSWLSLQLMRVIVHAFPV
jgi:hypothetical protein